VSFRITLVCLGNICRSPIAEVVLRDRIAQAGLAEQVTVDSAGTGDWHLGRPADTRAQATLTAHGYVVDHRARQIDSSWFGGIDLALAMDSVNFADIVAMRDEARAATTIHLLRSYDPALAGLPEPSPELDVPDPYEGDSSSFEAVLHMIESAADGLVGQLGSLLPPDPSA